ncbi:MAG TPA: HRDC domain-containing protein [Flavilitoribacter sp.]|nr:HRDC domain-containing protein [Flavilitoribacter sp.]HMQ86894.1 HRDC domain-containing protein [Flavilitoribacter sp.]
MQIKIFSIPILGGELMNDEMNAFLRSKKVLQVENQLVSDSHGAFWCFCIRYIEDNAPVAKPRPDYKQILDEESFQRFARMKEIRKQLAKEEGLPPYAVFSDEELAGLAKIEVLTPGLMKTIKGVGDKKVEKYAHYFTAQPTDEKSE